MSAEEDEITVELPPYGQQSEAFSRGGVTYWFLGWKGNRWALHTSDETVGYLRRVGDGFAYFHGNTTGPGHRGADWRELIRLYT